MKRQMVWILALAAVTLTFSGLGAAASPAEQGEQLFQSQHCVMCHGAGGKGFAAIHTPDFTSAKWQDSHSDKEITDVITNGKQGTPMPAFGKKLTSDQIQYLVAYIRSLNSEKKK